MGDEMNTNGPCPVCGDNAAARRRAEADLADVLQALAELLEHSQLRAVGDPSGLPGAVRAARELLDRHRAPETWRRGAAT